MLVDGTERGSASARARSLRPESSAAEAVRRTISTYDASTSVDTWHSSGARARVPGVRAPPGTRTSGAHPPRRAPRACTRSAGRAPSTSEHASSASPSAVLASSSPGRPRARSRPARASRRARLEADRRTPPLARAHDGTGNRRRRQRARAAQHIRAARRGRGTDPPTTRRLRGTSAARERRSPRPLATPHTRAVEQAH